MKNFMSDLEHFETKDDPNSLCIFENTDCEIHD